MNKQKEKLLLIWVALLSALAGFVNLSTMAVYDYSTSHYTGNISRLIAGLFRGEWQQVLMTGGLILFFLLGAFVSGLLFADQQFLPRKRYGLLLISLGILYFLGIQFYHESGYALLAVAFMMGLQNAMFIEYKGRLVRTTHFTGYLSDAGFAFGSYMRGRSESLHHALFMLLNIFSFGLGGLAALKLHQIFGQTVLDFVALAYVLLGIYYVFLRRQMK